MCGQVVRGHWILADNFLPFLDLPPLNSSASNNFEGNWLSGLGGLVKVSKIGKKKPHSWYLNDLLDQDNGEITLLLTFKKVEASINSFHNSLLIHMYCTK